MGDFGGVKVTCDKEGTKKFDQNGKSSSVKCENPEAFCKARFGDNMGLSGKCHDSCLRNGRCERPQEGPSTERRRLDSLARNLLEAGVCPEGWHTFKDDGTKQEKKYENAPYKCWCYSDF